MPTEIHRLSREYAWWEVTTDDNLQTSTASVAFMPAGELPEVDDWQEATLVLEDGTWWVRFLIGPEGGYVLAPGDWQEWLAIDDTIERPVRKPGILTVT
jgi:hypothetical protein